MFEGPSEEPMAWLKSVARRTATLTLVGLFMCASGVAAKKPANKEIFGWLEKVEVGSSRLDLIAKLDTGADTSSLDARGLRRYRRESGPWAEFTVKSAASGRQIKMRKRILREARIKVHDGAPQERPVVGIAVCLGTHLMEIEVTLVDRSEFEYPVLLGRNALRDISLIDPSRSYSSEPKCAREESEE